MSQRERVRLPTAPPVVEERLLLLLTLLAERWGRVRLEGVQLKLPLTHDILRCICGARRPSITVATKFLRRAGIIECGDRSGTWLRTLVQ